MTDTLSSSLGQRDYALVLTSGWTMLGVLLCVLAPMAATIVLPLAVLAPLAWCWAAARKPAWHQLSPAILALLSMGIYLLINCSWSLSQTSAYLFVFSSFAFVLGTHVTLSALRKVDDAAARAMSIGFLVAVVLGGAVLCFEVISQQWLHRLLMSRVSALLPSARHMRIEAGQVVLLQPYLLNRSIATLALLLWPAVIVATQLKTSGRQRAALLLALTPAVAAIVLANHATSKIALFGSGVLCLAFWISAASARRIAIAGWTAAVLFAVPLASLAYSQQLYLASWLPHSARHRIVIWGYTSAQFVKAPLLGAGIDTARALGDAEIAAAPRAPGTNFPFSTSLHSHNGYLQAWYETGAVGVIFLLVVGLLILQELSVVPAAVQPCLYATFAAGALLAASSFSLWAPWFAASFGIAAVFAGLGLELAMRRSAAPD